MAQKNFFPAGGPGNPDSSKEKRPNKTARGRLGRKKPKAEHSQKAHGRGKTGRGGRGLTGEGMQIKKKTSQKGLGAREVGEKGTRSPPPGVPSTDPNHPKTRPAIGDA